MKRKIFILSCIIAVFLFSLYGMNAFHSQDSVETNQVATLSNPEYLANSGKGLSITSSYIEIVEENDLYKQASLITRGKIVGFNYLTIQPVYEGGVPRVFTDYYIEPVEILRGEPENEKLITVRVSGGETSEEIVLNRDLELKVGEEYLFFLCRPETGGGYYTEGKQYYIVGINQGLFNRSEEVVLNVNGQEVPKSFTSFYSGVDGQTELDYLSFVDELQYLNKTQPVDKLFFQNRAYRELEMNLKSEFITEEEYKIYLDEMSRYATIIDK